MQLYPYTDSKNTCSLQTRRARPVPNTAPHVSLLAERFLLRLLLARLCAAAQDRVLPVPSLLPKPACSSLRPGEAAGVCGEEAAAEPQRRPLCCRRTAAGCGRSARPARPGSTAEGPAQQGKPRDCESRNAGPSRPAPPTFAFPRWNSLCGSRAAESSLPRGCRGTRDTAHQP